MTPRASVRRRLRPLVLGCCLGLALVLLGLTELFPGFNREGDVAPGHETLTCHDCHKPSRGSFRRQIQAKARYWLGLRASDVEVGHDKVRSPVCLNCHHRPNERHPIYRFLEPRYARVRASLQPHRCVTCHVEHSGHRVASRVGFCVHCHQDIELKSDPVDISHRQLAQQKRWGSCLGCHDFHGNHQRRTPAKMRQVIPAEAVLDYFAKGPSPYAKEKYHVGKKR